MNEADALRARPWMEKGCDHCRSWFIGDRTQERPKGFQARYSCLYHCGFCQAWWTDNQGDHPHEIPEDEALQLLIEYKGQR